MGNGFNYVIKNPILIFSKPFCHCEKYWELTDYFQFYDSFSDDFFKIISNVCKLNSLLKCHHDFLSKKKKDIFTSMLKYNF